MPDSAGPELFPRETLAQHAGGEPALRLMVTLDTVNNWIQLTWRLGTSAAPVAELRIRCTGRDELSWELQHEGRLETDQSSLHRSALRARLKRFASRFRTDSQHITAEIRRHESGTILTEPVDLADEPPPWQWIENQIVVMSQDLRFQFSPLASVMRDMAERAPQMSAFLEIETRRLQKEQRKREELQQRIRTGQERQRQMEAQREAVRRSRAAAEAKAAAGRSAEPAQPPRPPLPPIPVDFQLPATELQQSLLPLPDLRNYFLRERAALWWVSNQSDDLLGLPYCRIERLEYQVRTALRVLGPLRGRALLSDEVGLGKTIEAGLVIKEYLTRGMIKRFLILTVPSLVDQWEEELAEKFQLTTATTNQPEFRSDAAAFWQQNPFIIASLHTAKQAAHLAVLQTVHWDMLVVDEAHYLRNRSSQAWQAVNSLPRQFLLLLTATPVQNSLEELYNLVTLLQPGQLPSPKEFRERFIDKARPHQPRDPEELRRLLGQVMIRNTRANAGVNLPPRRAETVLFEPDEQERTFWEEWERELRSRLAGFSPSQSSLWGRLLLQSAGSSPAAWRQSLTSFPDQKLARAWQQRAVLEANWKKKVESLVPLTKGEGGVVIFTQFLQTQSALAEQLQSAAVPTWVINGQTPAVQRQPITEEFHRQGGALLLTHSGTEGRNLQFCHRLVNFDLPWNPMEIEQRIGRLHRLGQQRPVLIYNFVQAHTLQEHLLQILQEKLNLFELVVGETGLILGERFSSDEFAEEVLRRWREAEGRVSEAMQALGEELAAARSTYNEVKQLDETLFAKDFESL